MEHRNQETSAQNQTIQPKEKTRRFKLIRLEERIAPGGPPANSGDPTVVSLLARCTHGCGPSKS
jgi:hypothetical protein